MSSQDAGALVLEVREDGDVEFEKLLEPVLQPGYRLACGMLHDPAAAEDAVQQAAVKAWRKLGRLRPGEPMRPWFLGIVANECRNLQRSKWWSVLKGAPAEFPSRDTSADAVLGAIELRRALRSIGEEKRLVVVLHWYLDLPLDEIAAITRTSVHAVESRLRRGMDELRRRLEASDAER